jgi:hypothetical protein
MNDIRILNCQSTDFPFHVECNATEEDMDPSLKFRATLGMGSILGIKQFRSCPKVEGKSFTRGGTTQNGRNWGF